jgi:hypothetical protein
MIVIATTVPKVQKWLEDALAEYAPQEAYCWHIANKLNRQPPQSRGFQIWIIWKHCQI